MSEHREGGFSRLRSFIWPIHRYELKKFIPMLFLFFFITFNYTILRDTKDTLIVTTAGAESLPFIKVWGTMPVAILFMLVYAELCNYCNREILFYLVVCSFLIFFALFTTVLYPHRESLCPTAFADYLHVHLPEGLRGFVACIRYWPYTLFDIFAELWGSTVLGLLFWGFANDTTKISEAKRFYALFGIGANLSLLVSGPLSISVSNIRTRVPPGTDAWHVSLYCLTGFVIAAGFIIMAIYWWIHRYVLTDKTHYDPKEIQKREEKTKVGLWESLSYLLSSPYILCIAAIVVCYGICINLLEVTWKDQLRTLYPHPNDYNTFMGYFSATTGITTLVMMLFVGGNLLRKSWYLAAIATPIALLVTGIIFFGTLLFGNQLTSNIAFLGTSTLFLTVLIGAIQNIICKASKYSLLDPSKEMAYIPLDNNSRIKGKAVIDVVGSRLGKSGGSFIQQILLLCFGSLSAITPYIAVLLLFVIWTWIHAVNNLNSHFSKLATKNPHTK